MFANQQKKFKLGNIAQPQKIFFPSDIIMVSLPHNGRTESTATTVTIFLLRTNHKSPCSKQAVLHFIAYTNLKGSTELHNKSLKL